MKLNFFREMKQNCVRNQETPEVTLAEYCISTEEYSKQRHEVNQIMDSKENVWCVKVFIKTLILNKYFQTMECYPTAMFQQFN
jgi:hypothetical protein